MGSKPIGISASRGAAVLGLSNYTTQFQVWQQIMEERNPGFNSLHGYVFPEFEGNASTRWGLAFEDSIIELAEQKTDDLIGAREKFFSYKDFITCHIDGCYSNGVDYKLKKPKPKTLHEGKTTTAWTHRLKWGEPGSDRIPQDYHVQVQHQMLCTGAEQAIVSVLVFPESPEKWEEMGWEIEWEMDKDLIGNYFMSKSSYYADRISCIIWAQTLDQMGFFHQYTVNRNQELICKMVENYSQFWQENILGEIPPDPKNYEDIKRMVPNPCGTIIVDDQTADWYREYKDINEELRGSGQMGKRREQLKVKILDRARKLESTIDDDSTDKWIFLDPKGEKVGQYSKTKKGYMFR